MSEYVLALQVWSGVAAVAVTAPFLRWLVGETLKAVGYCDNGASAPPPSFPSRPLPSSPG